MGLNKSDLLKTDFASAERDGLDIILNQKNKISQSTFVKEVIAEFPLMFFILNTKRQIVYSNHLLAKKLGYKDFEALLSFRPGEVLSCVNSKVNAGGCGTSSYCQFCGLVLTLLKSDKNNQLESGEVQLVTYQDNVEVANDLSVDSKPFIWEGERFFIVTLNDISSKKKKEQLERIFFHDLLNKAGSVDGLIEILLQSSNSEQSDRLKGFVRRGMKELLNDISFQRELLKAENNELVVTSTPFNSLEVLTNIKNDFLAYMTTKKVKVLMDEASQACDFTSDEVLLGRVLTNLTKNAIEASENNQDVRLYTTPTKNSVVFSVNNKSVMPKEVQMQLFKRSFSTKGQGRGIGTYSVKLFVEKYLKGSVRFTSKEGEGTTFFVELPCNTL